MVFMFNDFIKDLFIVNTKENLQISVGKKNDIVIKN